MAEELLKREVLFASDLEQLIGKRPFEEKKLFEDDTLKTHDADSVTDTKEETAEN